MVSSKFEHFFCFQKETKKYFRKRFYPKVRSPKRKRGGSKSFPIRRKSLTRQRLEVELLQLHRRRHQRRIHAPTHTLQSSQEEEKISGARQTFQTVVFDFVFGFLVPNLNLKRSPNVFCHIVRKSLLRLEIGSLKVGSTLRKHSDLRSVGIFFRRFRFEFFFKQVERPSPLSKGG